MQVQTKIFPQMDVFNLEHEVNDFLKGKNVVDIKPLTTYESGIGLGQNLMVIYKEKKSNGRL